MEQTKQEEIYNEYMDELRAKYGEPSGPYYLIAKTSGKWRKNPKISRTKEGLYVHHTAEIYFPILSSQLIATKLPIELQNPQNLVYCTIFEHLLAHILIVEAYPFIKDKLPKDMLVGVGGINMMVGKLNDWYNGYPPSETSWEYPTWLQVKDHKDEYDALIERAQKSLAKVNMSVRLSELSSMDMFPPVVKISMP